MYTSYFVQARVLNIVSSSIEKVLRRVRLVCFRNVVCVLRVDVVFFSGGDCSMGFDVSSPLKSCGLDGKTCNRSRARNIHETSANEAHAAGVGEKVSDAKLDDIFISRTRDNYLHTLFNRSLLMSFERASTGAVMFALDPSCSQHGFDYILRA